MDDLWHGLDLNLVDILRYSGRFANFVGYSKIFEVFSKFLVDNIFSQCFWSPLLRKGDM